MDAVGDLWEGGFEHNLFLPNIKHLAWMVWGLCGRVLIER